ncbi:MAG: HAMP domain-containing histidine kinase [Alphaproteobacteria bacterium]|nr:HAMP domain-containing histidine kinase [Alphaproteobacteria bacterium]
MSAKYTTARYGDYSVFAGRIDILYALGRHYLSLPFAVLCVLAKLFTDANGGILPFLPLVLQIVVAVAAEQLTTAYRRRPPGDDPHFWARRYTFVSAIAGASWGIGVFFWLVPGSFAAQAYLCLAYMGMTATEFIARSAHRPAYLAHAAFSLGPLIAVLLIDGGLYHDMTATLLFCFGAALAGYCNSMARLLDESIRLKFDNAGLVEKLSEEKVEAEAARDAAEASASAKSTFIANISHELRTPLNALLGMAQLLDRADLGRPHSDHVKVLVEAGRGLQTLLDDVIALTQDHNGALSDKECDPVQAARAVARLLQPRAWEKSLRLSVTTGANLPHVAADPRRVRQALLKLADNGLKFTETGGVEIHAEAITCDDREFVRFAVIDTGLGVPQEVVSRLFKPFSPGDTSYARQEQGAGLGLAVVKRIVDTAGGETGFESEPGQGANFWFTLPAVRDAEQSHYPEGDRDAAPAPSGLNLLVFTGRLDTDKWLTHALEPFGNKIAFAQSAVEATARAGREEFDAIVAAAKATDMLAASPGVKAPIVALLMPGERAPVCAGAMLRWPTDPRQLYEALAEVCANRKSSRASPSGEGAVAAIDAAAFSALEKSVGVATLVEILKSYIETTEQLCGALAIASDDANWQQAARLAQDIAGSASGLGLLAMTAAARGFAAAAREGASAHVLRNDAQTIVLEHERVRKALGNLYPDLVA